MPMPSLLPDLLGSLNSAITSIKPANTTDLSHFIPTGLAVKQGVSQYVSVFHSLVVVCSAIISKKERGVTVKKTERQ